MRKLLIGFLLFVLVEGYIMYKSDEAHAGVSFKRAKQVFAILQNQAGYHVNLYYDSDLNSNAYCNYKRIYINQGMLNDINTNVELYMVLGHELGHFINQDYRRQNSAKQELRADKIGYFYCTKKYSKRNCLGFLLHMKSLYGNEGNDGIHPSWSYRYNQLKNL